MDDDQQTDTDLLGRILIGLAIVLMIVLTLPQTLGDLLAWPLERHRHKNTALWLAWNFLRLSVPIAICIVCIIWLIDFLAHEP